MKFKLDENIPIEVLAAFDTEDHEAESVIDEGMSGASDSLIMEKVRAEGRVLFTLDKGMADIRAYPPEQYSGVVLSRPSSSGRRVVTEFVRRHLPILLDCDLEGHLSVVTDRGIRRR